MISRVKDFDRIFLYVVAGVALVGLIGFGLYSLKGGGGGGSPKRISALGAAHSQTTSGATSPGSAAPAAQAITTLPAVPLPSVSDGGGAVPASHQGANSADGRRPMAKGPRLGKRPLVRKGTAQTSTTAAQAASTTAKANPPVRPLRRATKPQPPVPTTVHRPVRAPSVVHPAQGRPSSNRTLTGGRRGPQPRRPSS